MAKIRGKKLSALTIDQLQIAALKAYPSSPRQKEIRAEINKRLARGEKYWFPPAAKRKKNPASRVQGGERLDLIKAAKLYRNFTGDDGELVGTVKNLHWPKVAAVIGSLDGVMYTTVRDGKTERYVHQFKKASKPTLAVSPDGKMLLIVLGEYHFTERGIEDKK